MPVTYDNIATTTLGSAASSITFSSIPTTYTDLRIILNASSANNPNVELTFNGSGTGYSQTFIRSSGSAVSSTRENNQSKLFLYPAIQTTRTQFSIDIFRYTSSTNKTILYTGALQTSDGIYNSVALWRDTSVISSIDFFIPTFSFSAGTTATLYGIKNA